MDIGRVLRWLGFSVTYEQVKQMVIQVDLDSSGKLNLPELRKFIRMHVAKEAEAVSEMFLQYDVEGSGLLTSEDVWQALKRLHCMDLATDTKETVLEVIAMTPKSDA